MANVGCGLGPWCSKYSIICEFRNALLGNGSRIELCPEVEFLNEIQTKVFLLIIRSHLYSVA
jgi:hypothetical protein